MKRILYISYVLPSVTTTFVYREIHVLKNAGYCIDTLSMSEPDPADIHSEAVSIYNSTTYLDKVGFLRKILAQVLLIFQKPATFFSLFHIAVTEKESSGFRDRIRLIWHFIESGYLYSYYKDKKNDQIHATFLNGPASIAFFLSRYLEIPFSFTIHASNIFIDPIMLGRKLATSKKIVTISRYNKEFLLQKYGNFLEYKIHIIHCGIDVEKFNSGANKKDLPPVILSVGQLTERKGFLYLLEACKILKTRKVIFQCNIIGDGEDREKLVNISRTLGVEDVVDFMGKKLQDEVLRLLQSATVFCLPSTIAENGGREGIPVAIMEAMAMELPVISTDIVGIPELVTHNKEGMLVPEKDPEALADALEKLLEDKEMRKAIGAAARSKVSNDFNIQRVPKQFEVIFN